MQNQKDVSVAIYEDGSSQKELEITPVIFLPVGGFPVNQTWNMIRDWWLAIFWGTCGVERTNRISLNELQGVEEGMGVIN